MSCLHIAFVLALYIFKSAALAQCNCIFSYCNICNNKKLSLFKRILEALNMKELHYRKLIVLHTVQPGAENGVFS